MPQFYDWKFRIRPGKRGVNLEVMHVATFPEAWAEFTRSLRESGLSLVPDDYDITSGPSELSDEDVRQMREEDEAEGTSEGDGGAYGQ